MPIPNEIYQALDRAFAQVIRAEQNALKLEQQASMIRAESARSVQDLYDLLNHYTITLSPENTP